MTARRLVTGVGALALVVPLACGTGDAAMRLPEPSLTRDPAGALFCVFDGAAMNAFLASLGLPAPDPPLTLVEGGSGEEFADALRRIAAQPSADAFGELGMFFHKFRRLDVADACYRAASARRPDAAWWVHFRGDLAEDREDPARAAELFAEAARLDPRAVAPRTRRARALRALGRTDEMVAALEELLVLDPDSLFALTELASLALDDGDAGRAEELLERAYASWPRQRRVHVLLARVCRDAGRLDEAERFRRMAARGQELTTLMVDPWMGQLEAITSSSLFWKTGAHELEEGGRWAELLPIVRELDRREPGPYWKSREVRALVELGRVAEALERGAALAAAFPDSTLAHEALARALVADGRFAQAAASAGQALARDPRSWPGRETLVEARLGLGEGERAIEAAREFRELDPGDFAPLALTLRVHQSLGTSALDDDRFPEAAEHLVAVKDTLERARRIAPEDPACDAAAEWIDRARLRLSGG